MADMVIRCPDCGTSYKADSASIGANGRTVRCARCKGTWFVASPDLSADAKALRDNEVDDDGAHAGFTDRLVTPAPIGAATAVAAKTPELDLDTTPPTADVILRDQADAAKLAGRRRTIRLIWLVAALLAVAGIVAAFLNRQAIVNRQPETASLFQTLGADVRAGGLTLDTPSTSTARTDGQVVIRVEGAVRNMTGQAKSVPLIALSLHDEADTKLAEWFVEPDAAQLEGRGRWPFSTEYTDPPEGALSLRYGFAEQ